MKHLKKSLLVIVATAIFMSSVPTVKSNAGDNKTLCSVLDTEIGDDSDEDCFEDH